MSNFISEITGITVCWNVKDLVQGAMESVRKIHPDMKIIIVDGSDPDNECASYVKSLVDENTKVVQFGYNLGHGKGMHYALQMVDTKYALMFDCDIVLLKSPLEGMVAMMEEDTFGVGYIELVAMDGHDFGVYPHHALETPTKYLHPYFQLLQVKNYFKYTPYVHHGAPCYKTMNEIKALGLSDMILKEFPGLGHTSGEGINWKSAPREYVKHDVGGTRFRRRAMGLTETVENWE
jgi:GT2 family glycosyltransferase